MTSNYKSHLDYKLTFVTGLVIICFLYNPTNAQTSSDSSDNKQTQAITSENNPKVLPLYTPANRLYQLLQKITYGNASFLEVTEVLTDNEDVAFITNAVHSLHSMRWNRSIITLLDDLWLNHQKKYPELAWEQLNKVPVRIALASTINRIKVLDTVEYKAFIREHRYDDHEFHRAQVAISLGLNSDPVDVPYLKEMADGDNIYVAQTAITSLGIMGNPQAREALSDLARKYPRDDDRGRIIREVFTKAFPPPKQ